MPVTIRPELPADISAIHALTEAAFRTAPHTSHTEQFIVNALRQAGALHLSLVAQDAGAVVGHVGVSPVAVSGGAPRWYGLAPLSVAPDRQRQGMGALLVMEALRQLKDGAAAGCVLLGDPAYYARFGFRPVPGLVLEGVPPEYFQALAFSAAAMPQGSVSFHAAFNATR
ncbi:MAG: GNAT family N-acetyltransferase [Comamonadaceae bacterium SCN 68-20]|nr:N-acetyltransferase [Comamonadaceae bacterium]ODU58837.1 MAG: GNAT family N-acetyltransferase [Comamonadaceae bacterium SCN 68-20]OJX30831.1 MAG: GNAT family N-acetyltransferase [Burkholderiales bacterium 68-20]